MKKILSLLILVLLLAGVSFAEEGSSWQLYLLEEELGEAGLDGLSYDETSHSLVSEEKGEGSFELGEIDLEPFEYLVISWNSLTPGSSSVEIEARLFHDDKGEWSQWFSWGVWEKSPKRHSNSGQDSLAQLSYDTAWVLGTDTSSSKIELRGKLKEGASLRRIALTTRNTQLEEKSGSRENHPGALVGESAYSQQIRHPIMADVMCSAVTIATQLDLRGEDYLPEEVALSNYDNHLGGYGNWAFSVAFAGEAGYKAYVSYADEEELLRLLDEGYPLGMSVAYSDKPGGSLPYLEGAPLTTGGHLITLRGYEWIEDELYFITSDSAASSDEETKISYKASQLMEAWSSRIVYVIEEKEIQGSLVERLPLEFKKEEEGLVSLEGDTPLEIAATFNSQPLREPGRGLLAYRLSQDESFHYNINMTREGLISLPEELDLEDVTIYLISNAGLTYEATLDKNSLEAPAPQEEVEEEVGEEERVEEEAPSKVGGSRGPLYVGVGIVALILVVFFYRKKQRG